MEEVSLEEKEIIKSYRRLVKETNSKNWIICNPEMMRSTYFVPISLIEKMKDEIQEEFYRLDKIITKNLDKEKTTDQERVQCYLENKECATVMQTLAWVRDKLEELLDERNNTNER